MSYSYSSTNEHGSRYQLVDDMDEEFQPISSSRTNSKFSVPLKSPINASNPLKPFNSQNSYDGKLAVEIRDLRRNYGEHKVIKGLNMSVPAGSIYGLLGPSGCGKTTLLQCILGRLDIHGGKCQVLGDRPGARNHEVPGADVGFMPQDLALEPEFSTSEVLRFYSKLYDMDEAEFEKRKNWLLEFLDMPPEDQLIRDMSGGQKRRVSLCIALLHNPKLLILDEPTVGVDPLLRSKIWDYLKQVSQEGTTIIITTHYIEEARAANHVGLMRFGQLLGEGPPDKLMKEHKQGSLEDTFLKLCTSDETKDPNADVFDETGPTQSRDELNPPAMTCTSAPPRGRIIGALMWKSFKRMRRNLGFIVFQFFMPSIQVILFCLAIGKNPSHIPVSIVNHDHSVTVNGFGKCTHEVFNVGERFIAAMDAGNAFKVELEPSYADGVNSVEHGHSWGVINIPTNFTQDLYEGYASLGTSETNNPIQYALDSTNQEIAVYVEQAVLASFQAAVGSTLGTCLPIKSINSFVHAQPPIYGFVNPTFTDFIAPGMVICIAFAQAIGLTAVGFVLEKKSGIMDRQWAAGVRPPEILLSHVVTQFVLLFIQIALLLFFALVLFDLPMEGSLVLVVFLAMSLGMAGMVYGLLISTGVDDEEAATQLALGSFFPVLLLSGVIWPTQAIPTALRYISMALPTTWAAEAMRSIMSRGWGLDAAPVWQGFVITWAWAVFLFLLSLRGISNRKK